MPNSPENLLRDLAWGGAFQLKVFRQPGAHTEVVDLRLLDDLKQQIDWINTWGWVKHPWNSHKFMVLYSGWKTGWRFLGIWISKHRYFNLLWFGLEAARRGVWWRLNIYRTWDLGRSIEGGTCQYPNRWVLSNKLKSTATWFFKISKLSKSRTMKFIMWKYQNYGLSKPRIFSQCGFASCRNRVFKQHGDGMPKAIYWDHRGDLNIIRINKPPETGDLKVASATVWSCKIAFICPKHNESLAILSRIAGIVFLLPNTAFLEETSNVFVRNRRRCQLPVLASAPEFDVQDTKSQPQESKEKTTRLGTRNRVEFFDETWGSDPERRLNPQKNSASGNP